MRLLVLLVPLWLAASVQAQQVTDFLFEDFTDPQAWTIGHGWAVEATTPSNGGASGGNNLRVAGNATGTATTPVIDLRRLIAGGTLSYVARRTASFSTDELEIRASLDGGETYPVVVLSGMDVAPGSGTSWFAVSVPIPSELYGASDVRLMIQVQNAGSASATLRFDDFRVSGEVLFSVEPPRGIFAAEVGESESQSFVLYNHAVESIDVAPPLLSGTSFSISPSGFVTVPDGGSQEYTVTFTPLEEGVTEGGVEFVVSGGGAMYVPLVGVTSVNRLSFSDASLTAGEYETNVAVGLALSFSNEHPLQGFQADLSWDDAILELTGVAIGPALGGNGWTTSFHASGTSARIIVFNDGATGLPTGSHDPIVVLTFATGLLSNGDRDVTLFIDDVIGALAVPTADDAGLLADFTPLVVSIEKRDAFFSIDESEVDFGFVEAGTSRTLTLTISNPGGERALTVGSISGGAAVFSADPESAIIAPGASQEFSITFAPTMTHFGSFDGPLVIVHDGMPGGPHELPLRAIGTYGRGDNDGDGMVDAMDVVNVIDFVLGRETAGGRALAASDLFPFAMGDGTLDVRDLTVTVQGIVRGIWPDDVALPPWYETVEVVASKQGAPVIVRLFNDDDDLVIGVATTLELRALQLNLRVDGLSGAPILSLNAPGAPSASGRAEADVEGGIARLLIYRPDGGAMNPGEYVFARVPRSVAGAVEREYAVAIDAENGRREVEIVGLVGSPAEGISLPTSFAVQPPYPNPFRAGHGSPLTVPVLMPIAGSLHVVVHDLLGREVHRSSLSALSGESRVTWDGADAGGRTVPAGIYLVSVDTGSERYTTSVVVIR